MRAAAAALALLAGCAVSEHPYPLAWDPLVTPYVDSCAALAGVYFDRGERADDPTQPSLTRALFGEGSDWEAARRVQLALPKEDVLEVTVLGEGQPLFSRTLRGGGDDFFCSGGRLVVRSRRWIAGYIMSGRQHVNVELNPAGRQVVVQVDELSYGVLFVIFPVVGTAKHWYRFTRLEAASGR